MKRDCIQLIVVCMMLAVSPPFIGANDFRSEESEETLAWLKDREQPIDVGKNRDYDKFEDDGRLCTRDCAESPQPRTCYYQIVVEQYYTMGLVCKSCKKDWTSCPHDCIPADGIERMVLTMNRMLPGITINVCQHDRIIVDVSNRLPGKSLTFHWHGILQQNSPWMDGVAFLTQCPIDEGQKFRYDFIVHQSGTHFYHSHMGSQILDGLIAPLIVRTPKTKKRDPYYTEYDYDLPSHTIIINDWAHLPADAKYPGYHKHVDHVGIKANTYLINGKGSYMINGVDTGTFHATFHIDSEYTYRFRIIAATAFSCPFKFTIEDHWMRVIAVDGIFSSPKYVRSLVMNSGDRYDIIIRGKRKVDAKPYYWIIVKGIGICDVREQTAFLIYNDEKEPKTKARARRYDIKTIFQYPILDTVQNGSSLNFNAGPEHVNRLQSLKPVSPDILNAQPYKTIFLSVGAHMHSHFSIFRKGTYNRFYLPSAGPEVYSDTINNISCKLPSFPLLTQNNPIPEELRCEENCNKPICYCLHIYKIPLNEVVELVLMEDLSDDKDIFNHPMHLHGHRLIIMKQGTKAERQRKQFWKNTWTSPKPSVRDMVNVPGGGFSVVRFKATNPGFWMFHCHYNYHLEGGMFVVFQVGDRDDFLPIPGNLPKCGNYLPDVIVSM